MSAPVPIDHMIGSRPMNIAVTVIIFGRMRFTAPCTMASSRSACVRMRPARTPLVVGEIEEQQHEDAGLGVEAHQRDHADPDGDRECGSRAGRAARSAPTSENGTASSTMPAFTADLVFM